MNPDYLTVSQAARLLGKTRKTIYKWIESGRLPKADGYDDSRTYVRREDVEKILDQNPVRPTDVDEGVIVRIEDAADAHPEELQLLVQWNEGGVRYETDLLSVLRDDAQVPAAVRTVTAVIRGFAGLPATVVGTPRRHRYGYPGEEVSGG